MLNDHVFPVIASSGTFLHIHNASECDGADFIQRPAVRVSLHWADIDTFVKAGRNYSFLCPPEGSYKPVASPLPGLARLALKGAINIHIEFFGIALKKCPVVGR